MKLLTGQTTAQSARAWRVTTSWAGKTLTWNNRPGHTAGTAEIKPQSLKNYNFNVTAIQSARAWRVTTSWAGKTLTWNNRPGHTAGTAEIKPQSLKNYNFNVTAIVNAWYNGSPKYGFMISYYNEGARDLNSLYSSDCGNNTYLPVLTFNYVTGPALSAVTAGVYYIRNKYSGKYIDVQQAYQTSDVNIGQYNFNGYKNQQWKITSVGSGWYTIRPQHAPGMAMDVLDNSPDNTANIIQHKFHGARCQQFGFIKNANGSYRIVTKTTNGTRCLAVQYALTTDGGNIFQYNYGSQANDNWFLEKAETSKFSCALSSTPVHPDRAKAWAISESDYNRWPATSKSAFYNQSELNRRTNLALIKTGAQAQTTAAQWTVFPNGGELLQHYLNGSGTEMGIIFKKVNNGISDCDKDHQRNKMLGCAIRAYH